jgi:hypothetical protein
MASITVTGTTIRESTDVEFFTRSQEFIEYVQETYGDYKTDTGPNLSEDRRTAAFTRIWHSDEAKAAYDTDEKVISFKAQMDQYNLDNGITTIYNSD